MLFSCLLGLFPGFSFDIDTWLFFFLKACFFRCDVEGRFIFSSWVALWRRRQIWRLGGREGDFCVDEIIIIRQPRLQIFGSIWLQEVTYTVKTTCKRILAISQVCNTAVGVDTNGLWFCRRNCQFFFRMSWSKRPCRTQRFRWRNIRSSWGMNLTSSGTCQFSKMI